MKFLFLFILTVYSGIAFSQERWIDMEWDAVAGAKEYEVELFQDVNGTETPRGKYKTESSIWSHAVTPGKYSVRIRSLDSRGVPGEWSDYIPLKVRLRNPQLLRPVPDDNVSDEQANLEWAEVDGASKYQVIVKSGESIIMNSVTESLKMDIFLGALGSYSWTVLALEKEESAKGASDWNQNNFRKFSRVGGELEAPMIAVDLYQKVVVKWNKIRNAKYYEIEYYPPEGSNDKKRRFRLAGGPLVFGKQKLRNGVTTLSFKAVNPGYKDSRKSVAQIYRSGDKIEVQDIIQGRPEMLIKVDPTREQWRSQYFASLLAGQYVYESENTETDTRLDQEKLTGIGATGEWHFQPRLNSLVHKVHFSLVNLSSGLESGMMARVSYTLNDSLSLGSGRFYYGGGLSILKLPSFMGDRVADDVKVESSMSLGPEIGAGYLYPLSGSWLLEGSGQVAYHPMYISSDREEGEAFMWMRLSGLAYRYFSDKEAFFFGINHQSWAQSWSEDKSAIGGTSLVLGIKGSF